MELGMVGLGRVGANMTERLLGGGHRVVGFDSDPQAVARVAAKGAVGAHSIPSQCGQLAPPGRSGSWTAIPSTGPSLRSCPHLSPGDIVIDGGNSNYKETRRRADALKSRGLHFVDVGTSGGVWGLKEGYSLMIGGEKEPMARLTPVFETLAPAREKGWGHVSSSGAGHFAKMVHNGIEYGMMQALAEGFSILRHKVEFGLDLAQVAEIWRHGSVVRSWLLDLTAEALKENPAMQGIAPYVPDSGEGRWAVAEAIDLNVPAPVLSLSPAPSPAPFKGLVRPG